MTDSNDRDFIGEVIAEDADHRTNKWPCWSCKKPVSMRDRADNDGDCPHCSVELDIDEWPFPEEPKLSELAELRQQLADVSNERDEADAVVEKLSKLLAGVAVALRGPELPLRRHTYHDIPDRVESLKLRLNASEALLREASEWIKQNSFGGCDAVDLWERLDAALPQSAPATDEQGAV